MVAAIISLIAGLVAGLITFTSTKVIVPPGDVSILFHDQVGQQQINKIQNEVSIIKAQVAQLTAVPQSVSVSAKLRELDAKVSSINNKLEAMNKTIMASPEKALEIPMLRRDILALQRQYENATTSLEREITRAYDTIKWVVGTIVLGIIALVASVFLRGKTE